MRTSHLIYTGAALVSLMCGTLIANQLWPLPRPGAEAPALTQTPTLPAAPEQAAERPRIDVVFVLDTTGSMGGLLEGAKQTIWSIANRLASGQPQPDIRVGVVAYRDLGDEYVSKSFPLTRDLDTVHGHLTALTAGGGGDTPEHVNQGLRDAIHGMPWEQGDNVLRLIFLVGDAPGHDEYADQMTGATLAADARAKGITVNTIRCGEMSETAAAWQVIAQAGGGRFTTIAQDGGVAQVATPYDDALAELNRALAATELGWGDHERKNVSYRKARARAALSGSSAAAAASYSAKSNRMNDEDLVTALDEGSVDLKKVDNALLPAAMQTMSASEQEAYVTEVRSKRARLNNEILEVSRQRDRFIEDNSVDRGFDGQVVDILRDQAAEIGVAY